MPASNDIAARKAALRLDVLARRSGLADDARLAAAASVAGHVADLVGDPAGRVVAGYWPLAGEFDPRPAMTRLAAAGARLALPRLAGSGRPLAFRAWRPGEPLEAGAFGLREPAADGPAVRPDIVLVPLLAFDAGGGRLGYGKGYYDRTLAALRADGRPLLAVGVAFALQEVDAVPADGHDASLDAVVTEDAVLVPDGARRLTAGTGS